MPGLKDRLSDAGYGLGWSVVCRLPESWVHSAFRFVADLAWRRQGPRVQVLEGNLRRVIGSGAPAGQLRGLSRQVMRSYARYWLEVFRLPVMPVGRLAGGMHVTGDIQAVFDHLAAGRGVILALPHMGNYDAAGAWLIAEGAGSVTVVAERVKPESVYDRFVAFREGLGMEVLPASGAVSSAFSILAERLRAGKLAGLVCTALHPATRHHAHATRLPPARCNTHPRRCQSPITGRSAREHPRRWRDSKPREIGDLALRCA